MNLIFYFISKILAYISIGLINASLPITYLYFLIFYIYASIINANYSYVTFPSEFLSNKMCTSLTSYYT